MDNITKRCTDYLENCDIHCTTLGDRVFIEVNDVQLEISEEEISYKAQLQVEQEIMKRELFKEYA